MQKLRSEWEANLKHKNLATMPIKELWDLHNEIRRVLSTKLDAESESWNVAWFDSTGTLSTNQRRVEPTRRFIQNIAIHRVLLKLGLDEESCRAG
jgi:hypothetical protein